MLKKETCRKLRWRRRKGARSAAVDAASAAEFKRWSRLGRKRAVRPALTARRID
ncbi:MAG: hypothetical protein VB137_10430 [Burkholderia sp.]